MRRESLTRLKFFAFIIFTIFFFWIIFSTYQAIVTTPSEGDSVLLHIPLAKKLLTDKLLHPNPRVDILYPASTEVILLGFILGHIPLNLFNLVGIFVLFAASFLLGRGLGFDKYLSLVLGISISLLHAIVRWSPTQKPDIWMLAFFVLILWVINKKNKSKFDYLLLGVFSGFFIGAKFTAPVFFLIIFILFSKNFLSGINITKILLFLIPCLIIGCSWYIRNYFVIGSLVYLPDYSFISKGPTIPLTDHAWKAYVFYPLRTFNAYISEFMIWSFGILIIPVWIFLKRRESIAFLVGRYYLLGLGILIVSLLLPFWSSYTQIVGTMRYIFPMVFVFMLCIFQIARYYKKELLLFQVVLVNIIISLQSDYHPKVILLIVPLVVIYHYRKKWLFLFDRALHFQKTVVS